VWERKSFFPVLHLSDIWCNHLISHLCQPLAKCARCDQSQQSTNYFMSSTALQERDRSNKSQMKLSCPCVQFLNSDVCLVNSGFQILWSYDTYCCIYLYFIIYKTKTCIDFSSYCRHIGLTTKTDQTIFGVDPKLHICMEHLAHEWKYCIIVQFEINIDWLIDWLPLNLSRIC